MLKQLNYCSTFNLTKSKWYIVVHSFPQRSCQRNCSYTINCFSSIFRSRSPTRYLEKLLQLSLSIKSRNEPSNYTPVSLICICSKILEHILYSAISKHLEHHQTLCDEQHGFHKRRSCKTQLIITVNDFAECLDQRSM